jgi:hypothetical protein
MSNKPKKISNLNFQKMVQAFSDSEKKSYKDDRFYYPQTDKAGNASVVGRFLSSDEDDLPWVKYFHYGWKGQGGWYIENSLTTFNESDPATEYTSELWNSGSDENKKLASERKRKLTYVSKFLVISDPASPEKDGKVFFIKYGKKIHDKIKDKACPEFQDESPINVFDPESGCDFKWKIRKVEGRTNYDKSEFSAAGPLAKGNEKEQARIAEDAKKLGPLSQFLDRKLFKTYDELKTRLGRVLNMRAASKTAENDIPAREPIQHKEEESQTVSADDSNYFQSLVGNDDILLD